MGRDLGVLSLRHRRRDHDEVELEPVRRQCRRHPFDDGRHGCDNCGHDFCDSCFVYPKGPSRPGLCIPCAMARAGVSVRSTRQPAYR